MTKEEEAAAALAAKGGQPPKVEPTAGDAMKAIEDMKKQMVEQDKQYKALQEQNAALLASRQAPAPLTRDGEMKLSKDFSQLYSMPQELACDLVTEAVRIGEERVRRYISAVDQEREIRTQFYEENKDLKKHATIVAAMADAVQKESPGLSMAQALSKVAEKTREYLKSVRAEVPSVDVELPAVLPGSGGGEPPKPGAGGNEPPLSANEELNEYIKSRRVGNSAR